MVTPQAKQQLQQHHAELDRELKAATPNVGNILRILSAILQALGALNLGGQGGAGQPGSQPQTAPNQPRP